ncbi:hypothetical protein [Amycolatopsis vastitatis]|uniref:Uncharacterized protein n=1 Tax=Amycolatopsis vastitatis TaxID=1905142 RepID=A0A229SR08_9PSEU|nr:hypothetical protein [Amycolatopsis vastitatis]OXM61288.1 hypothetical protein CF165_39165 [Amycolatopsis vastitatis]
MSESPNYPNYPDDAGAAASAGPVAAPARPGTIEGAFWAFVASTVLGLAGGLLLFVNWDALADTLRTANRQRGGTLTDAQIDQAATITLVVTVVIVVLIAALYLLFAFKLRAGRNWARIVLTVLTALHVISLLTAQDTVFGYLAALAAVVGVVLSFTGPSNAYIAAAGRPR